MGGSQTARAPGARSPDAATHGTDLRLRRLRVVLLVLLAWLPFLVLWAVMNAAYFPVTNRRALLGATTAIGSAALLGIGVWWFCGRLAWPDRLRPGFYLTHLGAAAFYSAVWIGAGALTVRRLEGVPFVDTVRGAGWRFVMGIWLYGVVAGIAYVVRMRAQIEDERRIAAEARAAASEARLAQLRSQLNPHFLFNALHSLSYLVSADPEQARHAIERLGGLLRYSLEEEAGLTTLEREWAFTRDYLAIEQLRLEERLRVEASIEATCLVAPVPAFALQTLVENAVRHAAAIAERGACLRIEAGRRGESLRLRVEDDGPGADLSGLDASPGRGLRSLRERLAALYGDAAELAVESTLGGGFSATVLLPWAGSSGTP